MLTEEQAIAYCESRDNPSGGQIYNGEQNEWRRLANDIRRDGLEQVIADTQAFIKRVRTNTDPRHTGDTTISEEFLAALDDPEVKETFLADDLIESIQKEDPGSPLQQAIRAEVIAMLKDVSGGDENFGQTMERLGDLKEVAEDIIDRYLEQVEAKQNEAEEEDDNE